MEGKSEKENTKYLYGASVQGIQDFIFQTNKLKEIVGASELVGQICTTMFDEFGIEGESILRAAGNIKYIFDSEDACKQAVLNFPRKVMTAAPGITISQAVVKMENDFDNYEKASNELEQRLRIQRNKPVRSMTLGLMAIHRAPTTGLPAVGKDGDDWLDEASVKKRECENARLLIETLATEEKLKSFAKQKQKTIEEVITRDFDKMTGKDSWLAVIHADGNGMGNIVQQVCKNKDDAKTFSTLIDKITTYAAQAAYSKIEHSFGDTDIIPIRPIVLGGDDLTIVCRADLAINYIKVFLDVFEEESKVRLCKELPGYEIVKQGLTACAGIAFVKSSFPFHYSIELAESLCSRAKKAAKKIDENLAPSCLIFHKVQDSFVEDFSEIVRRELTPQPNLSFEYGPYYCGEHAKSKNDKSGNTIEKLLKNVDKLQSKDGNAIKSHLRQWLSTLHENVEIANQQMKRLRTVNDAAGKMIPEGFEKLDNISEKKIPYYDILSLASILLIKDEERRKQQ